MEETELFSLVKSQQEMIQSQQEIIKSQQTVIKELIRRRKKNKKKEDTNLPLQFIENVLTKQIKCNSAFTIKGVNRYKKKVLYETYVSWCKNEKHKYTNFIKFIKIITPKIEEHRTGNERFVIIKEEDDIKTDIKEEDENHSEIIHSNNENSYNSNLEGQSEIVDSNNENSDNSSPENEQDLKYTDSDPETSTISCERNFKLDLKAIGQEILQLEGNKLLQKQKVDSYKNNARLFKTFCKKAIKIGRKLQKVLDSYEDE
jgi:hypothetical protein